MRTRSLLALLVAVAANCSTETRRPGPTAWVVTPDGIGAIRVGMTLDELRRAVGDIPGANPTADCSYVRPTSTPRGVSVMLARGKVARVEYLTVRSASPADSLRRMVFETENGRVTRFRAGRVPEVEWVERCG